VGVPRALATAKGTGVTAACICRATKGRQLGGGSSRVPARSGKGSRVPAKGGGSKVPAGRG